MKVFILQRSNKMELKNAIDVANATQPSFHFDMDQNSIQIDTTKYELTNKAFDLNQAIDDYVDNLVKQEKNAKEFFSNNPIFVTSLPFSDEDLVDDFQGKSLQEELSQCYFYDLYKYPQGNIALISTYIWDHLPQNKFINLPTSPSGRRVSEPYLLFEFASIVLDPLGDLAFHETTRGCPFDYCNNVYDIDEAFRVQKICKEHKDFLQDKVDKNFLTKEQFDSVIGLFTRSFGKVPTKSTESTSKRKKTQIQYNFSEINNSSIIVNSPSATISIDQVSNTKDYLSQLSEIFSAARFNDEKYKQRSLEILSSILDEVQKPEPNKLSIQTMISILSSMVTLATSIEKIAPSLLDKIRLLWQ